MPDNYKKGKHMLSGQEASHSEAPFLINFQKDQKLSEGNPSDVPIDPKAVAEYSADLLTQLRDLATASGLTFLAYLVQVAVEEAKIQVEEHKKD